MVLSLSRPVTEAVLAKRSKRSSCEVLAATGGLLGLDIARFSKSSKVLISRGRFSDFGLEASGYLDELSNALPELVVCTNLEDGAKWSCKG